VKSMKTVRPYSRVLEMICAAGLRPTRQRLALAKVLFENGNRHTTAEMLHIEAQAAHIRVSLATVYNTLRQFTNAGLLREMVVDASRSYFDTNTSPHQHFFFEESGELVDIREELITLSDLPPPPEGTTIDRVDVVVRVKALKA
jgi:Fur family iron response transcriptional regulator